VQVRALKAIDGSVMWAFGPAEINAVLDDAAYNPDSQEASGYTVTSNPVLSDDEASLCFVGYGTFLLCLDASTGSLNWISAQHG
jgi:outer membrane protein assembly factor BamB